MVSLLAPYRYSEDDFKKQKIPSKKRGRFYEVKSGVLFNFGFKSSSKNTPLAPLIGGKF